MKKHYGILLLLCQCQLRHINHVSINIATSILGGQRWHGIWRIRWIPTRYWRSLWLWSFVLWKAGWMLTNRGHMGCINNWIIQWRRHSYHQWWKLIDLWVTALAIKAPVITRIFLWRSGWLLTNRGQLRCIDDWIIQWRRHRYHWWWQLVAIWVTFLVIKATFITRYSLLPTLIVPCSAFVATTNTLWMWHDEFNMTLWWCCVHPILFVDGHQNVRANFLAQQLQSCLSLSTRNKIDYELLSQYNPNWDL